MKSKNKPSLSSYDRAKKKVQNIKGFYGHLVIFIIANLIVIFTKGKFLSFQGFNAIVENVPFLNWINWDVYGTPIIWGLFLISHGLNVFGKNPFFGKAWEERQLRKYLGENNTDKTL